MSAIAEIVALFAFAFVLAIIFYAPTIWGVLKDGL